MNTANLLNINISNSSASSGKASVSKPEVDKNQGYSADSNINTIDEQQVSGFENALKDSMQSKQNGQNPDGDAQQTEDQELNQSLPKNGKQLPITSESVSTLENLASQEVKDNSLITDDNHPALKLSGTSESDKSTPESIVTEHDLNKQTVNITPELSTGTTSVTDVNNGSSTAENESSDTHNVEGNQLTDTTIGSGENKYAPVETVDTHIHSGINVNNVESKNNENTTIEQLNFIEQAQNTNVSVGVNSSAMKGVFQNISTETNGYQKIAGQSIEQNTSESLSVLQSSDSKGSSLFNGSMQDQAGKQQNFSQNLNTPINSNWMGATDNNQLLSENQTKTLNTENLVVSEKVDISNFSKTVSETVNKAVPNTENLVRQSEFSVKTPVASKGWNDEFNNHISYVAKNGGGNAKIKLNPLHLGPVEASIKIASEGVTVQITANQVTTRDALDLGITRLKEMLQEQGFSQVDVNVSDQGLSKGNRESTTTAANTANHSTEGDLDGADEEIHESTSAKSTINGVVDYYA